MTLTNEIQNLPTDWALTPVRGKKCIRNNWQSEQPLSRKRLNEIIKEDLTITGFALRFGSFSGNLIGLDLDGELAISLAKKLGFSLDDTVSCTSGKPGRRLEIFKVPDNLSLDLYKAKIKIPAEVEGEAIEIRLHRSCSCIPPSIHPETNQPYYWLNSPEEHQVKAAPKALLQEIIKNPVRSEETELAVDSKTNNVELNKALDALLSLDPRRADDYDSWFEVACAFKHACYKAGFGEIGWLFFELWSRQSDSYRSWDGRRKWYQISANGGIKTGSLFQWSQEDGNEPPQRSLESIGLVQAKEVCQQILNSPPELFDQNYQLICETFKAIRESLLIQWVELNNHFDFELDDALDAWGDADYSSGDWDALQRLIGRETTEQEQPDASDMSNSTEDNQGKLKVGQKLLAAISYREVEFYLNQDEQAWVDFPHKDVIAASPVDSPILRKWLRAIYWEDYQDVIGNNPLEEVIATLEATTFADDSSPQKQTGIRVIKVDDAIYIDLGSDTWEVIEVTAQGWRKLPMDDTPVRFKRNKFTKTLPIPAENGDIAKFRSYCNISDQDWQVLLAFIFSCYAGSQYWILALVGAEGTGKSVLMDMLQSIIDPSVLKRDRAIKSENDLINVASNSFLILQDNLSAISHQMSDALCVLASGGSFRARKLFTDNEIEGASFRNPVILNGIVDLVSRPDLSDRVLPVSTLLIEGKERKDEEVLTEEFNRDLPVIFAGLLVCLSAGLKHLTATKIDGSVRMKRAMRFAVACGERLGYPIDSSSPLFQAVLSTQSTAKAQLAEYDIFDSTLLDYFSKQKKSKWLGTAKELHEALTKHLGIRSTQSLPQGFPKSARWMVDKLRRDLRLLKMMGLEVKLDAGYAHGHRKLIQILLLKDFSHPKAEIVAEASLKHDRQLGESKRGGKNSEEQNPKSKSERDLEACETNGEAKSESLAHQLDSLDPENSII